MKKTREIAMYILGGLIVAGFFILLYILLFQQVPEDNKDILQIAVGALIGAFTGVVGYFYGSSAGSKDKTEMIGKQNNENK